MSMRQADLFFTPPQPELFEQRPERKYVADPAQVRTKLHKLLAEAKAARSMPWDARTVRLHQTIFPQMANWLPEEEATQLRLAFAAELARLNS